MLSVVYNSQSNFFNFSLKTEKDSRIWFCIDSGDPGFRHIDHCYKVHTLLSYRPRTQLILQLYFVISLAASTIASFPAVTHKDVELIVARYLNNARDRNGGRVERSKKTAGVQQDGNVCKKKRLISESDSDSRRDISDSDSG